MVETVLVIPIGSSTSKKMSHSYDNCPLAVAGRPASSQLCVKMISDSGNVSPADCSHRNSESEPENELDDSDGFISTSSMEGMTPYEADV